MKQLLIILIALMSVAAYADDVKHITLEAKNTVSLREEFTASSVDAVKSKLIDLDQTLGPKEEIYLYQNTPGGNILAGSELIDVIRGLKHKVNVIDAFAASMGYMLTQATTGKRYVTPSGILMAHRAYVGTEGNSPGSFEVRVGFYKNMITNLELTASARTSTSLKDYQDKVREEYWVMGEQSVKEKQADEVVTVSCSADLSGTTTETLQTMFGPVGIVWANCPLISEPVAIDFASTKNEFGYSAPGFESTITEGLRNKRALLNPALEEQYNKFVK